MGNAGLYGAGLAASNFRIASATFSAVNLWAAWAAGRVQRSNERTRGDWRGNAACRAPRHEDWPFVSISGRFQSASTLYFFLRTCPPSLRTASAIFAVEASSAPRIPASCLSRLTITR